MANKRFSILLICSWYPSDENPGYGSFVEEQVLALLNKGHSVKVVKPSIEGSFYQGIGWKKRWRKYRQNEVEVLEVKLKPILPGFRPWTLHKLSKYTLKILTNEYQSEYDIIHSHAIFDAGIVSKYLSDKMELPWIHTEHATQLIYNYNSLSLAEKTIANGVMKSANRFLFVSTFFKDEVQKMYGLLNYPSHFVLGNMLAPEFTIGRFQMKKKYTAISIQSMTEVKQPQLLLLAWKDFYSKHPESNLLFIGKGPLEIEIQNYAKELGIFSSITFSTYASRKLIKTHLNESMFYISSSAKETFGLSVAEALSQGLPVVCIKNGGSEGFINSKNGILTENSAEALAQGIELLFKEYDSFNFDEISNDICNQFNENEIMRLLELHYDDLVL